MDSTTTSTSDTSFEHGTGHDADRATRAEPQLSIPAPRTAPDTVLDTVLDAAPAEDAPASGPVLATPETGPEVPEEFSYADIYHLTAASRSGGLQRGNLAVLIRYWTRGRGAGRIGWGRGGDFMRCVRLLARYVPPNQVKGFCARLHRRVTGSWPGPGRDH